MAKLVTTFVYWRGVLVSVQGALANPSLTTQQSAEGYALLQTLQAAGTTYDLAGDDSPLNTGTFSVGVCQPYMDAAVPVFLELDRVARYIYSLYASTVPLNLAQAFGLYPGATSLPPGVENPAPLTFAWQMATAQWALVNTRVSAAVDIALINADTANLALLNSANNAATPYMTPPTNPDPSNEAASAAATNTVNAAMLSCNTWLASLSFS